MALRFTVTVAAATVDFADQVASCSHLRFCRSRAPSKPANPIGSAAHAPEAAQWFYDKQGIVIIARSASKSTENGRWIDWKRAAAPF
jgi:hypothetical protein